MPHLEITPFEYTGAFLGVVLVFRTNSGHDRWWEARKLWGSIVNQCRNLVIQGLNYASTDLVWRKELVKWVVAFPFSVKEGLRNTTSYGQLADVLSGEEMRQLTAADHPSLFVTNKIASLLKCALDDASLDGFAYTLLEKQRVLLIDYLGGCERILKTPMPLVYAIKTRQFIFIFLLLLPFSIVARASGLYTVFIYSLVAYPLLSLDRIGIELQNPFVTKSLNHLPLDTICDTIKRNCLAMLEQLQDLKPTIEFNQVTK